MRVELGVGKKMDGGRLRPGCRPKVFAEILVQSFVQNLVQSSAQKSVPRFEPVDSLSVVFFVSRLGVECS